MNLDVRFSRPRSCGEHRIEGTRGALPSRGFGPQAKFFGAFLEQVSGLITVLLQALMIFHIRNCLKNSRHFCFPPIPYLFLLTTSANHSRVFFSSGPPLLIRSDEHREEKHLDSPTLSNLASLITTIQPGNSDDEIFQNLMHDKSLGSIHISYNLVDKLLHKFKDDWKSALGVFRWARSSENYKHEPEAYDMMVDILGKTKQMNKMKDLLEEMGQSHLVTLNTIAKVMRRFSGAGQWEDAVKMFDELGTYGVEKNTESMNLLLDALCKANRVERARAIFLELKSSIPPNAHTFNIFIHGWCKVNRVDEAHWTIQEMKGYGFRPCVISYSTIIQSYCQQYNFNRVYEIFDEMKAKGCPPNIVTYTTVMCSLTKSEEFEEALQIHERMKLNGCNPDTLFYNCLIHTLGRAGKLREAIRVFEVDMPENSVSPNTSTYNSMIAMFCRSDQEDNALKFLKEIENSLICKPDVQTYFPLFKMCFRTGKIDGVLSGLLDDMVNKHHLSLDISTYTLLIHGLCRADKCEWAHLLFEEMIARDITPRYNTCCLLLDQIKQKNLYDAADRIEGFMKKMKTS